MGLSGSCDARPASQDGLAHQADRLVLAHHPLVEDVFQVQQLLPLTLHELCHRDACPPLHNPGDLLLGDLVPEQVVLLGPGGIALLLFQLLFQVRDGGRT